MTYKPLFSLYLDVQKQLILEDLAEDEVRGRWKSFMGKWNRGELVEGWYDPATLRKAAASAGSPSRAAALGNGNGRSLNYSDQPTTQDNADASSDDDIVGPSLPTAVSTYTRTGKRSGPAIPNFQDLELQRELATEENLEQRSALRQNRALESKQDKERLEELVPRAEPGTRERQLEKKREKAATNRAFAVEKTEAGGVEEVAEADLLGGGEDGLGGFKNQKKEMERKKNEREIRREEMLRARAVEREERIREYKAKEEKTMSGLVALAKQRFG
ncbi:hypothetical protein MMC08_002968 [Hypocenomyce scalaris]|nr:hypothetical protein [Hypocenomyce scalaris]